MRIVDHRTEAGALAARHAQRMRVAALNGAIERASSSREGFYLGVGMGRAPQPRSGRKGNTWSSVSATARREATGLNGISLSCTRRKGSGKTISVS
jgi:hypothetical protein